MQPQNGNTHIDDQQNDQLSLPFVTAAYLLSQNILKILDFLNLANKMTVRPAKTQISLGTGRRLIFLVLSCRGSNVVTEPGDKQPCSCGAEMLGTTNATHPQDPQRNRWRFVTKLYNVTT